MGAKKSESWSDATDRKAKNGEHLATMEAPPAGPSRLLKDGDAAKGVQAIHLPKLDIRTIGIRVIGDSPLICHRWSEKAKKEMLDKQMGRATAGKEPKDPERDYQESLYHLPDGGYGFPTVAFKNAAVTACTSLGKSISKVAARQAFHVIGEMVVIEGEPRMREDMVKIGMGTADLRYRAEFPEWACALTIRFNARLLTAEQIVNLMNTAGFGVGVGEWRAERDGSYGLFHVETA